jgi:hypothetical protein
MMRAGLVTSWSATTRRLLRNRRFLELAESQQPDDSLGIVDSLNWLKALARRHWLKASPELSDKSCVASTR